MSSKVIYFTLFIITNCNFISFTNSFFIFEAFNFFKPKLNINLRSDDDINPDIDLPSLDLIKRAGYPSEAHVVQTADGYLLTLHRIPGHPGSQPVLLQHGLLGSSVDWLIPGKERALAYLLADQGYDVWLGNARGNTYSKGHMNLSVKSSEYWDFSFHEMGLYDLPAVITFITAVTEETLIYVGHSMGTTMSFIFASEHPALAAKVKLMISLAPVGYMTNIKSPLRLIAPFADDLNLVMRILGADEFLPDSSFVKLMARVSCDLFFVEEEICESLIFVISGFDAAQFNRTLLPVILSHEPAGASTKTLVHYAQEIKSGHFRPFDYGEEQNMKRYNSLQPPDYNLSRIKVPFAFFYANNDWLAAAKDVKRLYNQLPVKAEIYEIGFPKFNHLDYLWAIDAKKLLYNKILQLLSKYRD